MASSIGLDEELARRALLRPSSSGSPSRSAACLLSPAAQAVLLRAALTAGGERRVSLVTSRADTLEQIERVLEREFWGAVEGDSGTDDDGGAAEAAAAAAAAGGAAVLVLNPYYRSPWGKKKVLGERVEEGEGLGPRKELFELAARQLGERWRSPPVLPSTSPSSSSVTATAVEGTAEVEFSIPPPSSDASDGDARAFLLRVKDGWRIRVERQTRILTGLRMTEDGGGGGDGSVRSGIEIIWQDSGRLLKKQTN